MKTAKAATLGFLCAAALATAAYAGVPRLQEHRSAEESSNLGVVWTSGDRDVALKMVFMYTLNAKSRGWFDEVRLVVWGPSAKLLSVDQEIQAGITAMAAAGVELVACKACADSYGVSDRLTELGVEVKYMGVPLSDMLKGDWETVTF
jgi:hypothetical protein